MSPLPVAAPALISAAGWRGEAKGERPALQRVLNHAHQPAAKSLIWRVQGATRGSPGAPGRSSHPGV